MKSYLKTLIAILILASLWGGITYYNRRQSKEKPKAAATKPAEKLVAFDKDHVQSFTVKPRDGDPFTLTKVGKTWAITAPRPLPADQSVVETYVSSLSSATVESVADANPTHLKDFGLDPPATTIQVTADSQQKFTVLLGDQTPTSTGLYAAVAGSPRVVSIGSWEKNSLEKTMFDLRDRRALTLDVDKAQRIDVTSKGPEAPKVETWTLERNPEGAWDLVLPPPVRTDHFSVDSMVKALGSLTMQSVVAEDKKKASTYGFGSPALTVKVTGPDGTQSVIVGKQDGARYDAENSALDPVFTLDSTFLTQFQKDPADLRDKDMFSSSVFDAQHLEVTTPQGQRVFDQQKGKWKQTAPTAKDELSDKMEQLLTDLGELRATSFPAAPAGKSADLARFGLAKPAFSFKVTYGDKKTDTVEVGSASDHYYVRRSTDALPGEFSKVTLDNIEKDLGQL
ncbi:MAG TPA: DUF4340 domain-containing protein [Terriglobia bacterium]|nr:DUF4340 domain-containing protein [Terriglobia bacterium]